ncbi:MAG: 3-deoxy-manno-octulosonate cytidylyltransferase [Chlamydiales bacterium]|nr:3-deoxy-manno-octulosonate cytidylyltransferase [Chlamydiales bacterium]
MVTNRVIGIMPARYGSTRFPAKMLAVIAGKTLLQHSYENAQKFEILADLIIATDDQRIFDHVLSFGGKVVMTSPEHPSGTDRLAEVVSLFPDYKNASVIVNIQGDEPFLSVPAINGIVHELQNDPEAVMATAASPIRCPKVAMDSSVVKCVFDNNHNALYFSRALIPASHNLQYCPETTYYQHYGVYAFRPDFLMRYAELPRTALQLREDLEQLKILEHGYRIKVAVIQEHDIPGVNLPEDVAKVEPFLCQRNISSSLAVSAHP